MRQVRFTVDPMWCGPLGVSVTTVTEYTGSAGGHTSINVSVSIISTMSIENFVPHNLFTSVLVKFLSSKILIDYTLTDQ